MKKLILAAAIATALGSNAFAATNLDSTTDTERGGIYATQLVINGTTGTALAAGAVANLQATATLGATFSDGAIAYVRYDLSSGTFGAVAPALADGNGGADFLAAVSQGGAPGDTFVIFALTPVAQALTSAMTAEFSANRVVVTSQSTVSVTYALYETLTNAANSSQSLKSRTRPFVQFASALSVTPINGTTKIANVSEATGAYRQFTALTADEPLLGFTAAVDGDVAIADGNAATDAILGATNSVSVSGNFSFVSQDLADEGVYLSPSESCAGVGAAATTLTPNSAAFSPIAGADILNTWYVCALPVGDVAIEASTYSGSVTLVSADTALYTVAGGATGTGEIKRNGVTLKAAFAETTSATATGVSSAVHLTNTSSIAARYTVNCITNAGTVDGTPGTLAANSAARLGLSASLGCPSTGILRGLEMIFEAPAGSVIGSIVRQNVSTGQAGFDGMIGNQ